MIRSGRVGLVLVVLLLLPAAVSAQRETKQTREASKYIGLAMTRSDDAERMEMYRQALQHLREGMTEDPQNARVWLIAGSTFAALGQMAEADSALDRALALHPDYAEEIEGERENAWINAFNEGIQLMDQQRYDEAIAKMEAAQTIYSLRPEALMNLGALYSNAGQYDKAVEALRGAIEATHGPLFERLDEAQKADWVRFRSIANSNIAQILGQQGVAHFQAETFDAAATAFLQAAEINPHARDYWFNYGQSLWAQSSALEEQLKTASAQDSGRIVPQLRELYAKIQEASAKTREFDPNNEVVYLMAANTHRMMGELDPSAREASQQAALRMLEAHAAMNVALDQIAVLPEAEGTVRISGMLKNLKATEGSTVTIRFTLVDIEGNQVGEGAVTATAPAAEQTVPFESTASVTGEVAGWKYTIAQ